MNILVWEHNGLLRKITVKTGQTILQALQSENEYITSISAPCGGRGVCGKCIVRIIKHCPEPSENDIRFLTKEQLEMGFRLACCTSIEEGMELEIEAEGSFDILTEFSRNNESGRGSAKKNDSGYALAVDIGTTTLAMALVELSSGNIVQKHAAINNQRALGADVISRIQQADNGKLGILNQYIIDDISRAVSEICKKSAVCAENIKRVVIAGNATMLHILMNVSCHSLGQYPFTPVFVSTQQRSFSEIFGMSRFCPAGLADCNTMLLPGISAYVGSDITAGILYCVSFFENHEKANLLIDLGTNGEMALFSHESIVVTATAAGPAFEAANISCGTGSVPGAVSKVVYLPHTDNAAGSFICETINNVLPPIGICGSGVTDIAAQLVTHGLVDETGLLEDEYFDDGIEIYPGHNIRFTQKDMRELQLAKSAVRSGFEVLLADAGISYGDIGNIFLAGGFGYHININSAAQLGIIPGELVEKVIPIGNSALGGCVQILTNSSAERKIIEIAEKAKEINLSADARFNELFMEHMYF